MKKPWTLLLCQRYLFTRRAGRSHAASFLPILGISVGVLTIVTVLSVMNGATNGVVTTILEIGSYHAQIETKQPEPKLVSTLKADPTITSVVSFRDRQALLQGRSQRAAVVRGIAQDALIEDAGFRSNLSLWDGVFDLSRPEAILLGENLAAQLKVSVGDSVTLLSLESFFGSKPKEFRSIVTGIFSTGYPQYDTNLAFTSLHSPIMGNPSEPISYGIKLENPLQARRVVEKLRQRLDLPAGFIHSWHNYNRAFFTALRVEKLTMLFLMDLVFLVVAVNIYHSLKRSVVERIRDMGALKALGASPGSLQLIFIFQGLFIGISGAVIGVVLGIFSTLHIDRILFFLDQIIATIRKAFGASHFSLFDGIVLGFFTPVIEKMDLFFVSLSAVFAVLGASILACRRLSRMRPAEVLRYD